MKSHWKILEDPPQSFINVHTRYSEITCKLLWNRNLREERDIEKFFNPDYDEDLHDPFLFNDMQKAVERVIQAVAHKEKIVFWGDYDADGVSGTSLLYHLFTKLGAKEHLDVYIPDRNKDGYGINLKGVEQVAQEGAKLLISVDCGLSNIVEITRAKELGVDVIICDHHLAPEVNPPALAVLNPKALDTTYPFPYLSGTGVAFKLAHGVLKSLSPEVRAERGIQEGFEKWLLLGIIGILGAFFIISIIPGSISVASRQPEEGIANLIAPHEEARAWGRASLTEDFTILALGVAGGDNISPNLTDAILLIHIKDGARVSVFSLPRDLYVESPESHVFRKINDLYRTEGIASLRSKVEEITGVSINAHAIIDLRGVGDIVDAVGGVYIPVQDDFNAYAFHSSRKVFGVPSGFRYFDGSDATTFIRYRPDSDFGRMHRQQLVIEALRKKFFGLHPLKDFDTLLKLFATIQSHLTTDLGITDLEKLYSLGTNSSLETRYYVFDTENLLRAHTADIEGNTVYVLEPTAGRTEYRELQSYIKENL